MQVKTVIGLLATITVATCHVLSHPVVQEGDQNWWKHAVFYQIYPRSFKDSNNDGNGDLAGILEKLSHIKDAGVTAIWISPIMASPQVDQGYDISDYYTIDPMYGNMDDLKVIIDNAHKLGIKVILDFVPNHTSNEHAWFVASENGEEEYKDYYVWVNGTNGTPPNNWVSIFKHSAWEWSDKRQQYYLHEFATAQVDLNYRNLAVREAMKKVLVFYMDLGIDGFRIDAVPFLIEDDQFRDEPRSYDPDATNIDPNYLIHIYTQNLPGTYDIVYEWREVVDNYTRDHGGDARAIMTESYANVSQTMLYFGTPDGKRLGAHFTFNFNFITDLNLNTSNAHDMKNSVYKWLDNIPDIYTSNWVMGNHDQRRVPTRLGKENVDGINMLMAFLPGIGVTYNGEEIGQEDGEVKYEEGQDPSARNESIFQQVSRDFERTPFQWDYSTNAGFNTGAKPWLPVSEKHNFLNLASQLVDDLSSHFRIYQALLKKRKEEPARNGTTDFLDLSDDVVVLKRTSGNESILVVFKLGWDGSLKESVSIPNLPCSKAAIALTSIKSNYIIGSSLNVEDFVLRAHEALVLDLAC